MRFDLMHPADQLVMIMDRIYKCNLTTISGGNLSVLDQNGDIWVTPSGIDKGSLTRDDMIQVKPDGTLIGKHRPSIELPFHREIYRARPDLRGIVHAHPPTLMTFCLTHKLPNTRMLPIADSICGKVSFAKYAIPGSDQLSINIAEEFANGSDSVLMENHGVVCGSTDLFRAFMSFETLDTCARLQMNAARVGRINELTDAQIEQYAAVRVPAMDSFVPDGATPEECAARRDMCALIHRAYDRRLFTSTQGTFSLRLSDNSILVTPYNEDRKYLEPKDLVLVRDGKAEAGKQPSRAVRLIEEIYRTHPEIHCVILAEPAGVMSFAVTDAFFDALATPERYITLRDVKRLPYGCEHTHVAETAAAFGPKTFVTMVNNDCIIVTGNSLLNAYDRLELIEYCASAFIDTRLVGDIVDLTPEQVTAINGAFHIQ